MEKYLGLEEFLTKDKIKYNESMKDHTTVKVGGKCDCMVIPTTIEDIEKTVAYAKKNNIPFYVIGNGSDLLVTDDDIHILIIKIVSKFSNETVEGEYITTLSGTSMPKVSILARQNYLHGLEFACGIPGTVGGGVRMNAGAYGSEMANVVEEVTYLDSDGDIHTIGKDNLKFGYRHSLFVEHPDYIILSVKFKLQKGNLEEIESKMKENMNSRREKQPLEYPNFGSVFKRPEGYFVGKLVSDSGLRGVSIGGAQVSTKHTGFIINTGNATCKDILDLIKLIQDTVYEKFNVHLQTEVEFIGGDKK